MNDIYVLKQHLQFHNNNNNNNNNIPSKNNNNNIKGIQWYVSLSIAHQWISHAISEFSSTFNLLCLSKGYNGVHFIDDH